MEKTKRVGVVLAADARELERRLDHARGGVAVAPSSVRAESDSWFVPTGALGGAALLALQNQRR